MGLPPVRRIPHLPNHETYPTDTLLGPRTLIRTMKDPFKRQETKPELGKEVVNSSVRRNRKRRRQMRETIGCVGTPGTLRLR